MATNRIAHDVYDVVPQKTLLARAKEALKRAAVNTTAIAGVIVIGDQFLLHGMLTDAVRAQIAKAPRQAAAEVPRDVEEDRTEEPDVELEAQKILEERFRIPRAVWVTLARRESGFSMFASRYEPTLLPKVKHLSNDPHEQRWYASSHGRFQVLGLHVPRLREKYGLDITEQGLAFDPRQNALAAGTILSECFRDSRVQRHKQNRDRLKALFACYNGTGSRADAYADAAMRELGQELLNDVQLDIQPAQDEMPKPMHKDINSLLASLPPEVGEPFIAEGRE